MTLELLSIQPNELKFTFEVKKQSWCSVHLVNNTDQYVAYKVKTTSPKKYCVRPNIGIVVPRSTCDFTVTMQAQRVAPPDMQCKDKFLIQSTIVPYGSNEEDISPTLFTKENGRYIQENKLKVVLVSPPHSPVLLPINGTLKQEPDFEAPVTQEPDFKAAVKQVPDFEAPVKQEPDFEAPAKQEPHFEAPVKQEPDFEAPAKQELAFGVSVTLAPRREPADEDSTLVDFISSEAENQPLSNVVHDDVEELKSKIHDLESKLNELLPRLNEADKIITRLTEAKNAAIQERNIVKQELAVLRSRTGAKLQVGFPFLFVCFVALVSLYCGYVLRG